MSVAASSMHPGPRTSKMLIHQLKSLEASSHLGARDIAATPVSGHENGVANGNKGPLDVLYSAGGEGMTWRSPTPEEQRGGSWLVGYNVRVFWDDDQRYADGHFTEVFDESTRWQLAVPVSKKLSPTNGSSSRRIQGDVAECSARLEQKRPREFERPPVQEGESGVGASDLCGLENASRRTRERKLSVRMREAVLDLTDDSEDDFRCDLYKMRNGQQYSGRNRKKPRKGDGMSLSPTKERSTALKFAGSLLPKDFLQDTKDPLFVGCNVEVRIEPKAKVEGDNASVRVVTPEEEDIPGTFVFYPWEKSKELGCIVGYGRDIRIPMGVKEWKDVGAGRHVRVAFDDNMNYLGVIGYATACKDWHVFFEDGEEISIKVPAEDAIPVPVDCSEWLSALGTEWWGHKYASRLRNGAPAERRSLRDMQKIVEDRLDRSTTLAFRARLPVKLPSQGPRDTLIRSGASGEGSNCEDGRAIGDRVKRRPLLPRDLRAKLKFLREREDSSVIRWYQLCSAIQAAGGLSEIDIKQGWSRIMENLRVDPSKVQEDSGTTFRTWYIEKKKAQRERQNGLKPNSNMPRTEEPAGINQRGFVKVNNQLPANPRSIFEDTAAEDAAKDFEEDLPLRPRKLTERVYQQHLRNLKDLFFPSLLGTIAGQPKWRVCALAGNPCLEACNCNWASFAAGVGALASSESKVPSGECGASSKTEMEVEKGPEDADCALSSRPEQHRDNDGVAHKGQKNLNQASSQPCTGFVCLSNVVGGNHGSNAEHEQRVDPKDNETGVGLYCARCQTRGSVLDETNWCNKCIAEDSRRCSSATIVAEWWRQMRSKLRASASTGSNIALHMKPYHSSREPKANVNLGAKECDEPSPTSGTAVQQRFKDPFAAYRCCGLTFLRPKDLERHWKVSHKNGVVACARGYADPANLMRKRHKELGLGVRMVTSVPSAREDLRLPSDDKTDMDLVRRSEAVGGGAQGPGTHAGGQPGRPQGRGKGGNFWLMGHRSLSMASSALCGDACESDDSIDIVIR